VSGDLVITHVKVELASDVVGGPCDLMGVTCSHDTCIGEESTRRKGKRGLLSSFPALTVHMK
jgi:hypothetical protein